MAFATLTIDLNARLAKFEDDMARVRKSMGGIEKSAGVLKAGLGGLFAGVGVAGLAAFAKNGIDAADALNDMSIRLGVSVKDLASFKLAAEQSGTSLEGIGKGIAMLTRSIGEAEAGNKGIAKSLKELGITARDPKEAFFQLADAVKTIEDPAKRATLLNDVLKKGYQELIPVLSQGSAELRNSAKSSETFSEAMARLAPNADKFNDNLAELKSKAAGAAGSLLSELVPALNQLFERFSALSRLRSAGASIFEIVTGGVSANVGKSIQNVNKDIDSLETRIKRAKGFGIFGDAAPLERDLARLKSVRAELQAIAVQKIQTPPGGKGKAKPAGLIDIPAAPTKPKRATGAGSKSDPQGDFVKKLREEAATLGLSGEALLRYEANKLRLVGTNAKLADGFINQITAYKEQQELDEKTNALTEQKIALQGSALKGIKDYIAEQAFEASLIGKTNAERDVAIQLRASETAGINTQTEAYKQFREQLTAISESNQLQSLTKGADFEKIKTDQADAILLTKAFTEGIKDANGNLQKLSETEYLDTLANRFGLIGEKISEMDTFAKKAAENIQQSFSDFLFDPFDKGMEGMLKGFGNTIKRMISDAIAADLTKALFGDLAKGGSGDGIAGGLFKSIGSMFEGGGSGGGGFDFMSLFKIFGFAKGGIAANGRPLELPRFAGGGVSNSAAIFGEAGPEAAVPLPDGRSIPVKMKGGGATINITLNGTNNAPDVRRAGGQIAREISGLMSGAQRYA